MGCEVEQWVAAEVTRRQGLSKRETGMGNCVMHVDIVWVVGWSGLLLCWMWCGELEKKGGLWWGDLLGVRHCGV